VGLTTSAAGSDTNGEKLSLLDLYPPRRHGEKLSLQHLSPLRPARNGTPVKRRWGWVDVDVGSSEKLSLQDLYPPARNGTPVRSTFA
jgi:hypothetical protein